MEIFKKKFLVLGILAIVAVLAGAGYFIYSQESGSLIVAPVDVGEKNIQAVSFDASKLPPKPIDIALAKYYDDAIKYENAILKFPKEFEAYLGAGLAWKSLGDLTNDLRWYNFSADVYRRAVENFDMGATHYVFWLNLGNVKTLAKKYNEAESVYRDGLKNFPNEPQLYLTLAELYKYNLKKPQSDVIQVYEDALSNVPAKEKILQFYAPYLEEIGNYKQALFYFEQLAKVYSNEQFFKQKINNLKSKTQ